MPQGFASGGGGSEEVEQYMLRFLRTLGCRTVGSVGGAPESKRTFPDQQPERDAFRQRMRGLVIHQREG